VAAFDLGYAARWVTFMRAIFWGALAMVITLQPARGEEQRTFYGKTVDGWREVLRDKASTAIRRRQAAWALGCFGPEAKAAVPDLIEALRNGQFKVQAAESLAQIGSGSEAAVPILIERFLKQGCQHLTGQGTIFYDDSTEESLVSIGSAAVPALVEVLTGPNIDMRVCATEVLGRIGPAAREAVPSLIREIEHPDLRDKPEVHIRNAVEALGRIGPEARAAVPALNHRLLRQGYLHNLVVEFDVLVALDQIGASPVAKLLEVFLRDADPYMAEKLAWLGPRAHEAIPSLRAALTDKRPQVRIAAAVALTYIDPSATESLPALIEGLKHPGDDPHIVEQFIGALAQLGPSAKPAIPTLVDLEKNWRYTWGASMALVKIDPEGSACVPALISALGHDDQRVVDVAADCLGLLGKRAKDAVPALARILNFDYFGYHPGGRHPHAIAASALGRIGPEAKSAIPALIRALKRRRVPTGNVREFKYYDSSAAATVAEVLGHLGAEAKAAIPALIEVIRTGPDNEGDGESLVRQAAIIALGRIEPDGKLVISALRNLIIDEGTDPRYLPQAVALLCRLDPDGKAFAEKRLEKPWVAHGDESPTPPFTRFTVYLVEDRAVVLGAMGRTSVEGDCLTRHNLKRLDHIFEPNELMPGELPIDAGLGTESWFEDLGRLGVGGRLAIPRLIEFRKHPNPFVRMWASEALAQILPKDTPLRTPSWPTKSVPAALPPQGSLMESIRLDVPDYEEIPSVLAGRGAFLRVVTDGRRPVAPESFAGFMPQAR
jgi:HEAT repeat protein